MRWGKVRPSALPDAGLGLFANTWLPQGVVLPPYRGAAVSLVEAGAHTERGPETAYLWCPLESDSRLRDGRAKRGLAPLGPRPCVDARPVLEGNPARYVNGARNQDQCKAVNLEMCELGGVMYFRTTRPVPQGSELMTRYGTGYWADFGDCSG